jgi:hypothetical protein
MATQNPYNVTLLVTEAKTKRGVPNLTAEAWDKDLIFDDLVGSATTDNEGKALFTFDRKYFAELFLDNKPDLYFKIFYKKKLIYSTEKSVTWNVSSRTKTITVELPEDIQLPPIQTDPPSNGNDGGYRISGNVVDMNGNFLKERKVIAVDVDLKGAASYHSAVKLADISGDGFEFLGEGVSDGNGFYSIAFDYSKFAKAERGKADAVVYAIDDDKIVGRSQLVLANQYSDKNEVQNLFVLVSRTNGKTEYELLTKKLLPFLQESGLSLADLANSEDQITFTANELEENKLKVRIAIDAEVLRVKSQSTFPLSHELLYGIGRQQVQLSWLALYKIKDDKLKVAIDASVKSNLIKTFTEEEINKFLENLHGAAATYSLDHTKDANTTTLDQLLLNALPEKNQRLAFTQAVRSFTGNNYQQFWSEYLPSLKEFKNNPKLVKDLLLTQQLTLISGNHNPLIKELQVNRKISTATQLLEIQPADWETILGKTGIPEFIKGNSDTERKQIYAGQIQNVLNAAFPTQKIALMLDREELPFSKGSIGKHISGFLKKTPTFDIGSSRVHDFENEIRSNSPDNFEEVKNELKRVQRVFQVSTRPEVMSVLMENKLDSAYSITSIPRKSFIKTYSDSFGGKMETEAIYERATFMSTRANEHVAKMRHVSHEKNPHAVMNDEEHADVMTVLEGHIPNYSELFGSPDICECEQCRSVYSAAAYFVDLLRFLWRGTPNADGFSPLEMFALRRPDLLYLPLTCENTNTVIPYIDLVNEIMEYYTYHGIIDSAAAYDTGDTTTEELRANPQNFEPEAYKKLAASVYPFSLPYHQPLDVIRTYSDHLQTARYDVMHAMQKSTITPAGTKAISAEALRIGQEEYVVLTGKKFDGTNDAKQLHEYFGYNNALDIEKMAGTGVADGIHEFLRRSGMKYVELVDLVNTQFINPYQGTVDYLEKLFANSMLHPTAIYGKLNDVAYHNLDVEHDADLRSVLDPLGIAPAVFIAWVKASFSNFNKVITLYQSDSSCDLNKTYLRTVANVYSNTNLSGIDNATWSKIHRFIRLWRKLGWKLHEVDLLLNALGQTDITPATITLLSDVVLLLGNVKLQLNQAATLWGSIDTYGDKSLYKKLFLNKAVQRIDDAFQPDKFGNYLQDNTELLGNHIPAILAAFRMSGEDLQAVFDMEIIVENNVHRKLRTDVTIPNPPPDKLNIENLSSIYRFAVLSKALKLKVADCCSLMKLFPATPFSNWDVTNNQYINISPANTIDFCHTAFAVKKAGFKSALLQYILTGTLQPESTLGINADKTRLAARAIHDAFALIAQQYPDVPTSPLTADQIKSYLLLSFNADTVNQLMGYIESRQLFNVTADLNFPVVIPMAYASKYLYTNLTGNLSCMGFMTELEHTAILNAQAFHVTTDNGLAVVIPAPLSAKFTYDNGTGNITCLGMMTLDERIALGILANVNNNFRDALDTLLAACNNFKDVLTSLFNMTNDQLNASQSSSAFVAAGAGGVIPETLSSKYTYISATRRLVCKGVMSTDEQTILNGLGDADFQAAVNELYLMPDEFLDNNFGGVFLDKVTAKKVLFNHSALTPEADLSTRLTLIYDKYIPLLRQKLREDSITQHIAALIGLNEETTSVLVKNDLQSITDSLSKEGLTGKYFKDTDWEEAKLLLTRTDATVDFDWKNDSPGGAVPVNGFSVRWDSYLTPPASGDYTLVVDVQEADEKFNLYLDDTKIFGKVAMNATLSNESPLVTLNASKMHKLRLDYAETSGNQGVTFSWKTATTTEVIVPSISSLPADEVNAFVETVTIYHRAAKFILGFKLETKEVVHLSKNNTYFSSIDFKALTATHWKRISDYVQLRNAIPQTQATLIDVFAAVDTLSDIPKIDELINWLNLATAWDKNSIIYLVKKHFVLVANDFRNEIALMKLFNAVNLVSQTGIPVEKLADPWSIPETTNFMDLNKTAQLVKSAVKAKYEEADWLELAGGLSDKIRENQKQALISYLLTQPSLMNWGVTDADGLFEYFLIDVQMGACMDTSRIVQANSSVQMFVNRCLLNLESKRQTGSEKGVSPDSIDTERWEWMKYYRVWEANRKVFLYPENWLEPEWRDDRSPFFNELVSELVQNDITTRSVETAFRNYLAKLDDVANLDVVGAYKEKDPQGNLKFLHVFARTNTAPYHFYYRTWDADKIWSAWEKMTVDIRGVESGDDSGVHVIPVVWKNRLFVFWPEFIEKQEDTTYQKKGGGEATIADISTNTPNEIKPQKYWEIRIAWTERVDDKWSPKQLSKEFVKITSDEDREPNDIAFKSEINASTNELAIKPYIKILGAKNKAKWFGYDYFNFQDIQAKVEILPGGGASKAIYNSGFWYVNNYEKHALFGSLEYWGNDYLDSKVFHKTLFSNEELEKESAPNDPFFYHHGHRTYFVKPFDTTLTEQVKDPGSYAPPIIDVIDTSYYTEPNVPHPVGPDDYMPGPEDILPGIENYAQGGGLLINQLKGAGTNVFGEKQGFFTQGFETKNVQQNFQVQFNEMLNVQMQSKTAKVMKLKANKANGPVQTGQEAMDGDGISELVTMQGSFSGNLYDTKRYNNSGRYYTTIVPTKGLEFNTFYHPFSNKFITSLNKKGLPGLMESDTTIPSDGGLNFNDYDPQFSQGLVFEAPASNDYKPGGAYTFYKENVCFDLYGSNSIYNWELFFHAPLYIATRLSKNGKFQEAMQWFHYIFDPTTNELPLVGQSETSRFWKVLPFKTTPAENLEDWFKNNLGPNTHPSTENTFITQWRKHPFKPHLIARNRPLSYMKSVVLKYVQNLIDWADSLFRMDTMESVNEALQIYVIANHILGPRPEFVPKRGNIKAETYHSLKDQWDDFSNALVELENLFPYSSNIPVGDSGSGGNLLGVGPQFYFCIPSNNKLMEYWDTVTDRLFKIRHCMDIEGVERKLALFAPPIDPGMLINAAAQGLSLGSILADLSTPPPIYRFVYFLQRANDFCNEVKSLGNSLLGILEKRDGEELSRMRATHETAMLELITAVKERQVLEAKANREGLLKSRETSKFRLDHYNALLGNADVSLPDVPSLSADLNSDSTLPADTALAVIPTEVDQTLAGTDDRGVKILTREKEDLDKGKNAMISQQVASGMEGIASILHFIPNLAVDLKPFGLGAGATFGGANLGSATSGLAKIPQIIGAVYAFEAAQAAKMASFIRREQEWTLQANLAIREIIQLDKQLAASEIRIQITEKELENHKTQIENTRQVEEFIKNKFTGEELYQWMKEQLFAVYKQSYNLAYDMAKKAEKCYRYEIGNEITNFIQFGYWDNTQQGLCSGEKLHLSIRQMEKSFIEENKRELELTKSISIALLNPLVLQELKATGKCTLSIPEELFDLDYQGHYFRRIKSVSLSLPCIAGPYTTVNCTLRLMKNSIRTNTTMNGNGEYEHENDNGMLIDDDRFRSSNVPVKAIATSTAQRDSGMFEMHFNDERYLPFEGAGAISEWKIELTADPALRQFDYSTISDVILHMSYTAREDAGLFKKSAVKYLHDFLENVNGLTEQPLVRMFSMKHDFSTEWYRFLHPLVLGGDQILNVTLKPDNFPYFVHDRDLVISQIDVLVSSSKKGDYQMIFSATDSTNTLQSSAQLGMPENAKFGNMQKGTVPDSTGTLNLGDMNIYAPLSLKIKHSSQAGFAGLGTNPDELSDVFVVFHYALG